MPSAPGKLLVGDHPDPPDVAGNGQFARPIVGRAEPSMKLGAPRAENQRFERRLSRQNSDFAAAIAALVIGAGTAA